MCVCECVYIYIHTHTHTHTHTHIYIYIYIYISDFLSYQWNGYKTLMASDLHHSTIFHTINVFMYIHMYAFVCVCVVINKRWSGPQLFALLQ